jgi:hypothetical protein
MDGERGQRGQSIIIATVAIVALIGFTAIAIDGARAYERRRQMQTAADAGALAGAYQTCVSGTGEQKTRQAIAEAQRFAMLNQATEPIEVSVDLAERTAAVTVNGRFATFFAGVIGFRELSVSAYAKAKAICGGGEYVVWAHSKTCNNTIDWSGQDLDVDGDVHSNHDFKMGGQGNDLQGRTEYVTDVQYNDGNTINPDQVPYDPNWPVWYDLADFEGLSGSDYHYHDGDFDVNEAGTVLHGLYYVDGDVHIVGNDISGSVTIVATGVIYVSGTGHSFEPFHDDLLFFSAEGWPQGNKKCAKSVIDVSGSDCSYKGILFAPGGRIHYAGSGYSVLDGAIVANTVKMDGSGGTITGGVKAPQTPRVRLVE